MAVRSNLKLIFSSFALNVAKEWQYKPAFFMQIFMMIANNFIMILEYIIIYQFVTDLAGYTFNDALVLIAMVAGSFGITHMFFGGLWTINKTIYDGRLDVFLTQPKNVLLNIACSKTNVSSIGDFLTGFIFLAIAGAPWYWYLLYIPICTVSALLYAGVYATYASVSFWIKNADALAVVSENIFINTTNFPANIYDIVAKAIMFTVIPTMFFVFIPIENILFNFNIWWTLGYVAVAVFWVILAFTVFGLGLKKYNSGSVMGGRM